jgi:hypothetical protein
MGDKELVIWIRRSIYTASTTLGMMFFEYDGFMEFFGYTLEDTVRPPNVKVPHYTAIPAGPVYKVAIRRSPRFGVTVIFYTEEDKETIKVGDLVWKDILAHGGNTHEDTDGCILVAKNKVSDICIQGSLKTELAEFIHAKIVEGYTITCKIENLTQK